MEIFSAFGLDVKLLIANFINFLILVGVLYKFGYKPILKFVKTRQEKIEKGLTDAQAAAEKLEKASKEREKITSQAHKEAQEIIGKAKDQAKIQADALIKRAQNETRSIVERAKKEITLEKEQSVLSMRKQAAEIVISATEKLLRKKMDAKEDEKYVNDVLKEM